MAQTYGMVQKPAPVVPKMPVSQQRGYSELGLGDTAHFWDGSHEYWKPTFDALDTVWNTHGTIPVNRDKYLPEDLNLIAEDGRSRYQSSNLDQHTEGDDYFSSFGFSPKTASSNDGIYLDVPFRRMEDKMNTWNQLQNILTDAEKSQYEYLRPDDKRHRPTIGIMDSGWDKLQPRETITKKPLQSVGMHEFGGHYYDNIIAGQDELMASDIMDSYRLDENNHPFHQGEQNWTQESLYNAWMNDSRTAHLDLNDPDNTGLRTLLRNRSHHGGVVNPREGFGEYISTALTDPNYQTVWDHPGYPQHVKDYKLSNAEIFARAAGNTLRPQIEDEGFRTITPDLDRTFANSLATYLNSR